MAVETNETTESGDLPSNIHALFLSLGQLGRDLLEVDWAATPLGPAAAWPQSLKSTLQVMLTSRFSMWMAWGPELTFFANEAYCQATLGKKYPWALGKPAQQVWSEIWTDIGPRIDGVLRTGVASWDESLPLILERSGFPEETYHTFSYSPLADEDRRIVGMLCIVSEETSRVVNERRMRILRDLGAALAETRSEDEVYATVTRQLSTDRRKLPFSLIYRLDEDATAAQLVSAAGVRPGHRVAPRSLPVGLPVNSWPLQAAAAGEMVIVADLAERFARVPSGGWKEPVTAAALLPLMHQAEGRPYGILVAALNRYRPFNREYEGFLRLVASEIAASIARARAYDSERRRAEALAALDQAKTAFLTNVSHEFRTPLTLMLGPLEDAMAAADSDPATEERLEMVHRNGLRLLRMVNSLLDFARLEAGQSNLQRVHTDLGARTAEIASSFSDICRRAGIDLVVDCPPVIAEVDLDGWETIVLNLLSNAFKFTYAGSIAVTVSVPEPGSVQVQVADTGAGIAAPDLGRIFERFYRPASTTGRSAEGSGIGLALVRSLVERHGGSIDIQSAPGSGTTVTIRLPGATTGAGTGDVDLTRSDRSQANPYVMEAWQWLASAAGPDEVARVRTGRPVVLVVDDNLDMRRQLARVLGSRFDVVLVADGDQALAHIREDRPDLVVTDVMMPTLDGFGLVAAIRADPALTTLPVVMLSARAGGEAAGAGFEAGADDYIVKPFRSSDLLSRVTARLEAVDRNKADRTTGESQARRAAALAELGARLGGATGIEAVLDALLESAQDLPHPSWASIGLVEGATGLIRITYGGDIDPLLSDRYHVVAVDGTLPIAVSIRTNKTLILSDRLLFDERFAPESRPEAQLLRPSLTIPMRAGDGSVLGAVTLVWPGRGRMAPDDISLAEEAGAMVSRAVERIRVAEREHDLATEWQERLLQFEITSQAAAVCALYQPAGEDSRVGGDWYTATALGGDGQVALSVGDVVGHGLPAAAAMSQLRSALGAVALTTSDPGVVVDVIARYAATIPGTLGATLAYAIVDTRAGTVRYTCAGHPYPVLVLPDSTVHFLDEGRQPLLGTPAAPSPVESGSAAMPYGSTLILYTDGLIERRGESLDVGLDRLAGAAADLVRVPVGEACTRLLREMAPASGFEDDVALVALRPSGSDATSFIDVLAADLGEVRPARQRLRSWLADLDLPANQAYDVLLGVGEAVNNAIEHGCQFDATRRVTVEAFVGAGEITVSISDGGRWERDSAASGRHSDRGRGLTLMHGTSDRVETVRSALGTRVTLTYRTGPSAAAG